MFNQNFSTKYIRTLMTVGADSLNHEVDSCVPDYQLVMQKF